MLIHSQDCETAMQMQHNDKQKHTLKLTSIAIFGNSLTKRSETKKHKKRQHTKQHKNGMVIVIDEYMAICGYIGERQGILGCSVGYFPSDF